MNHLRAYTDGEGGGGGGGEVGDADEASYVYIYVPVHIRPLSITCKNGEKKGVRLHTKCTFQVDIRQNHNEVDDEQFCKLLAMFAEGNSKLNCPKIEIWPYYTLHSSNFMKMVIQ